MNAPEPTMLELALPELKTVLCLGAHSDDLEIGCGGTILKLIEHHPELAVHWIVFSGTGRRAREARQSAKAFLAGARTPRIVIKTFRDGYFPYVGGRIKDFFETLKTQVQPDLVFTHYRDDRHQDHRLISDLTWNTFRRHLILEYEIPKYDGDLGSPNVFVELDERLCRRKIGLLLKSFPTQKNKAWFNEKTFLALLKIRSLESGAFPEYAEAFYCRKATLAFQGRPAPRASASR